MYVHMIGEERNIQNLFMFSNVNTYMNVTRNNNPTSRGAVHIVGFILIFGILALLLGTVSFIVPTVIGTQTETVQQTEVKNVGDSFGKTVQEFDRHIQQNSATQKTQTIHIPQEIANSGYTITISETENENIYTITTAPFRAEVVYQSTVRIESDIETQQITGGDVEIEYNTEEDTIVVQNV